MHTLLGFFAVLVRLLQPTRGAHTTPFGYLWELGAEARRHRSRRVRRYVVEIEELAPSAHLEAAPPAPTPPAPEPRIATATAPSIPAPRPPAEDNLNNEYPQVDLVRGPYRAWEAEQAALAGVA